MFLVLVLAVFVVVDSGWF